MDLEFRLELSLLYHFPERGLKLNCIATIGPDDSTNCLLYHFPERGLKQKVLSLVDLSLKLLSPLPLPREGIETSNIHADLLRQSESPLPLPREGIETFCYS